jgi:hypothetical protein
MNFDLTTKKGVKDANTWASTAVEVTIISTVLSTLSAVTATSVAPLALLAYGAYKVGKFALSSDDANVKQAKAAEALIEAGRKNGVDEMTITIDHQSGVHLDNNMKGVSLKVGAGSNGKINLQVKYK